MFRVQTSARNADSQVTCDVKTDDRLQRSTLIMYLRYVPDSVANDTERNQVFNHITAKLAPKFLVMYLQVFHGTAILAPPTISFKYAVSK